MAEKLMLQLDWIEKLLNWSDMNSVSLGWTAFILFAYLIVTRITLPTIEAKVDQSKFKSEATVKAYHTIRLISGTVTIAIILIVWGVDFSGLLLLSTSLITLTGVALFASWSLLSSVTSYFVLLFHTSFRRGNFIRVIDADNYIEGYIAEINLFNTRLITEDREVVVYPNNLILTRPTIVNPRIKWRALGKIQEENARIAGARPEE